MMNFLMISLQMNKTPNRCFFQAYDISDNKLKTYIISVITMKRISLKDYNSSMGILIDVQYPSDYMKNPTPNSINVYADDLLLNYKRMLDNNKKYYLVCNKGRLSQRVVAMLEYFGYDVTQVIKQIKEQNCAILIV